MMKRRILHVFSFMFLALTMIMALMLYAPVPRSTWAGLQCEPPCTCVCPTATATATSVPTATRTPTATAMATNTPIPSATPVPGQALRIAHFTDAHVGEQWICQQRLQSWIVPEANALADIAIDTGDCTHHGHSSEWADYIDATAGLAVPWKAVPGNHDATWPVALGPGEWVWDVAGYRLIGLNCRAAIDWSQIDTAIADGLPTVMFGHYPPEHGHFGGSLWARIEQPNVLAYVYGHLHYHDLRWHGDTMLLCTARACLGDWTLITLSSDNITIERQ